MRWRLFTLRTPKKSGCWMLCSFEYGVIEMEVDKKLIKEVVDRILAVTRPEKIILFGSAATGQMGPDSDLDLLVIEEGFGNAREESVRLRAALAGVDIPIDIFPMEPGRFEETKNVIGGLAFPANKYGAVIYEAP